MAIETQTKLVGFCLGNKANYNATNYANHIWFDPTNKQILLNGIEYIPKKLSELVNDKNFITSITKSMVENVLTGNITSHTHFSISTEGDNRNVTTTPNDYSNKFVFKGLKYNSQIGSPASNTYSYLLGLRGWSDSSGGQSHELAFNNTGIYRRQGEKTAWGSWAKILDSDNYTDYAATKDHTHTFASITSKPTTLSGYGITDAALASDLGKYLPLTGGTLSGALTCNGDYINMNNDSGSRGYRGFFNQSNNTNRASGSHIFMGGGGYALGTNSVSIGYQAYAGIRNEDADKTTYPYIAWQWMPTAKFMVDTTNSATLSGGEYYGFPLMPNEMVRWSIDEGQKVIYENSSSYNELLVVIKASDADTGLVFGGKTSLPYRASKTLIAGKYIVGSGEYLKKIDEYTINGVKYYQVIIYTWNTTAFPTSYDFTQQVKVMCATKVSNSNYSGASSYASGNFSVASGNFSVASGYSSVASGAYSVASGIYSVASGAYSVASGHYSVASGYSSVASGYSSVASGSHSVASGDFSVVLARNGETMSSYQTIVGKFNAKVAGLFIIGNGTSDTARSNAFVVDDSGNVTAKYFSGYANAIGGEGFKIYAENTNQINFGGTGSDTTVVFGAASKDSRSVPTTYKFGADGKAKIVGGVTSFYYNYEENNCDANVYTDGILWNYGSSVYWKNAPQGMSFGSILTLKSSHGNSLSGQLAWDINHSSTTDTTRYLWWRATDAGDWVEAKWHQIAFTDSNVATATALTSSAGSATQPIYFSNGKPVACTYTLAKSVPSNAVFTDTTYSVATASADGLMSAAMFNSEKVSSISVRQGAVQFEEPVRTHDIYVTYNKDRALNSDKHIVGGDVQIKIPNATKDYDGSMSYTDKRKLDAIFNNTKIYNSVSEISESKMEIESGIDIGSQTEILDYWQLPMSTSSQCGLMSGSDKRKLDNVHNNCVAASVYVLNLSYDFTNLNGLTLKMTDFLGLSAAIASGNRPDMIRLVTNFTTNIFTLYDSTNVINDGSFFYYRCDGKNAEISIENDEITFSVN